jgi:hypothetical protein
MTEPHDASQGAGQAESALQSQMTTVEAVALLTPCRRPEALVATDAATSRVGHFLGTALRDSPPVSRPTSAPA